jgi:NAD(P)-dependent dehydrogenase (short-subunit alcohol dehydrogenase family)
MSPSPSLDTRYAGCTIVVTGAAGGIGREACRLFVERGAHVVLVDIHEGGLRDLEQQLAAPGRVQAVASALDSPEACAAAIARVEGPIHAVVHLAGVFVQHAMDAAARPTWDRTLAVNLSSAWDLAVAATPRLRSDAPARLVFVSSVAFRRGSFDHAAYSAAKGGLVGLTRALSRGLAPRVLVNALAPGIIDTGMPAHIIRDRGERLMNEIPLRRWGRATEVAEVIEFLCGPQSTYITGQVINVDGGIVNS